MKQVRIVLIPHYGNLMRLNMLQVEEGQVMPIELQAAGQTYSLGRQYKNGDCVYTQEVYNYEEEPEMDKKNPTVERQGKRIMELEKLSHLQSNQIESLIQQVNSYRNKQDS